MLVWPWRKKTAAEIEQLLQTAIRHHEAGRLADAESAYRQVIGADPHNVDALHFLGFLLFQRGAHSDAIEHITRSLARNPSNPTALINLGNAHQAAGDAAGASACFQKAVALQPAAFQAHFNLGIAQLALGEREAAERSFREAIRLQPDLAEAHYYLGNMLCDDDRIAEGNACFRRALELRPEYVEARWALALARLPQVHATGQDPARTRREFSSALVELERWFEPPQRLAAGAAAVGTVQPFSLAYEEEANRELLERHGSLCTRLMAAWMSTERIAVAAKRASGPIRVGIVSAHLRDHSVWHAIVKGWFQRLNRERFSLAAFHLGDDDHETDFARSCAAHFESGRRSLREWVDAVQRQRLDVLIYPEIGMDPVALRLASMRLAPVQACGWGHPETSGLPTMDYYLSADDFEPAGAQANYSETLVALPHLGCYFEPRALAEPPAALRDLGLDGDQPLLVCPGVPFKYAPRHDWIFPELAARLGRCRFVFFVHHQRALSDRLRARLQAAFQARGLEADRFVVFLPWLSKAGFLSLMSHAQVCLDTIGFSGFNTALQSVQAGLPIVTREGRFMRGRLASGILKRMDLRELVAASEQDYVALAEKIVRAPGYREDLGTRIVRTRDALFADAEAIRGLERFLEKASETAQG